ncbi:hypothetical protein Hanom_Chr09g00780181 [Helianthus anomalus]
MAIKLKPQGHRCKKFEFWTKVTTVTKPQGPKWQFTLLSYNILVYFSSLLTANLFFYRLLITLCLIYKCLNITQLGHLIYSKTC